MWQGNDKKDQEVEKMMDEKKLTIDDIVGHRLVTLTEMQEQAERRTEQ